ncbi:NAD(P)-binding protein [Apiospora kogelbergensis]|uniref:NAD(P)-binding protein n=1 Tax=Apiospora kogelbergensis TaxID=1337665 RepID=A0AAW0QR08_9PEZI
MSQILSYMDASATYTIPSRPLTWLITGCSSGFGLALARLVRSQGHRVIATSRNPAKTPELVAEFSAEGHHRWETLDVDAPDCGALIARLEEQEGVQVDVLVNNAGWALYGVAEHFSEDEVRRQFETLLFAPFRLTRAAMPYMRARKFGIVVNVSSASGLAAIPSMSIYGGAKAALDAVMRTFALEVKDFNVRMLNVNPGTFDTGMLHQLQYQAATPDPAYAATNTGKMLAFMQSGEGEARGDMHKGVRAMYDVVMGAGPHKDHLGEPQLPLGAGAAYFVARQAAQAQQTLAAFGELSKSCDKPEPEA